MGVIKRYGGYAQLVIAMNLRFKVGQKRRNLEDVLTVQEERNYQDKSYSNQFPNPKSSIKRIRATIIIPPTTLSQRFSFFNKKYPKYIIANKIAKTI